MEPRREKPHREEPKASAPRPEEKPKRFRIVKLEERVAPSKGGNGTTNCPTNNTCNFCTAFCVYKSFNGAC
jgi:hypothetical protein